MSKENGKITAEISITELSQFKNIIEVLGIFLTDERIDEEIRQLYLEMVVENIID